MEKNKTLKEVYKNSSEEVKEILKSKFSNKDLGIIDVEQQIRNEILDLFEDNVRNIIFIKNRYRVSTIPTPRIEISGENGDWLFDINYDEENKHFWYSHYTIYQYFESKYDINNQQLEEIMIDIVENDLNMRGVIPIERHINVKPIGEIIPMWKRT